MNDLDNKMCELLEKAEWQIEDVITKAHITKLLLQLTPYLPKMAKALYDLNWEICNGCEKDCGTCLEAKRPEVCFEVDIPNSTLRGKDHNRVFSFNMSTYDTKDFSIYANEFEHGGYIVSLKVPFSIFEAEKATGENKQ